MLLIDFNPTTPQSKVLKDLFSAAATLDINNFAAFVSKDFKFQSFPKINDLPDESIAKFSERYGAILSFLKKLEVRIRHLSPQLGG